MSDRDPFWDELKAHKKEKFDADRKLFLDCAKQSDDGGWFKHSEFHWSRYVNGQRIDYWPSRKKFMYNNKVLLGDVMKFIAIFPKK